MDLVRHLRLFIVVADELHFGRAAELIGVAQPHLSRAVRRLEAELGAELFDRSRRAVRLTAAGALLREEARDLVGREERLRRLVQLADSGALGELRAGVPPQTPARTLRALLATAAERHPGLRLDLQELDPAEQLRLLAAGQLDVGLVHHPCDAPELHVGPASPVALGVLLARTSPLARRAEVALAELSGHDLVLLPRAAAPGWYDRVLDVCRAGGFVPSALRHARDPEFLTGLVSAGHAVAFDDGRTAAREPRVAWRPLAGRPLVRGLSAVWPREAAHPAARDVARIVAETVADDAAADGGAGGSGTGGSGIHGDAVRPWSVVYEPRQSLS